MNQTISYYNKNAKSFIADTQNVEFTSMQDEFLEYLPPGSRILDFGCGSGRDALYFAKNGFQVDAVDGSEEMCRMASAYTGLNVRQMLFQELDAVEMYDGIWACSSILHLPYEEVSDVLVKTEMALVPRGIMYVSFKYGTYEGERNGRYFCDFTEERFAEILAGTPSLKILKEWTTQDVRPGRNDEKWLNVLLRKR